MRCCAAWRAGRRSSACRADPRAEAALPDVRAVGVYGHFGRTDVDTPWEETESNENALLLAALLCAKE